MIASTYAEDFCNALNTKFSTDDYEILAGRKFDKIVTSRSVHAFVVRSTGELVKPASFKAPQKDKDGLAVRYNLSDPTDADRAIEAADPYGSYLYK